jgi:hypothetical protein
MDSNFNVFAKLVAISIVGGVAKSLFGQPTLTKPAAQVLADGAKTVADTVKS